MTVPETQSNNPPLRKSAQRLRWFVNAFERQVQNLESQYGHSFDVDRDILAGVFAEWLRAFEAQKPASDADKPAYVGFAAGLMLQTLIKQNPVQVAAQPEQADTSEPAYFWPEGYLYVAFCLNVRGRVLETDFHAEQQPSDALNEARTWTSFRENVREDPSLAIAFLDLFAGDKPDWNAPQLFRTDRGREFADGLIGNDGLVLDRP